MNAVKLHLSLREAKVCSRACLTYGFVPFHRIEKQRTSSEDQKQLDCLFDRLLESRKQAAGGSSGVGASPSQSLELALSEDDLDLLIEVFDAVLQEHLPRSDHADYDLELHVAPRDEVEATLAKLRGIRQEQAV